MLVVGAGAIGDFYGAHLAHTGRNVTFLVRPGRAGQLARTGLAVKSPKGDISLMPNVVTANVLKSVYDVILIAVKGFALESVIADVAPAVGPDSIDSGPTQRHEAYRYLDRAVRPKTGDRLHRPHWRGFG